MGLERGSNPSRGPLTRLIRLTTSVGLSPVNFIRVRADTRPDLFNPITFLWDWPEDQEAPRFQVRLYVLDGGPFWFSQKVRQTQIVWNGLGNQELSEGQFAQPGVYWWRLRIEDESDLEYDTESRFITFE